ncbi:hypothetical protein [Streptomyces rochei]
MEDVALQLKELLFPAIADIAGQMFGRAGFALLRKRVLLAP